MNRIDKLFSEKNKNILNVYCTAGYPHLKATVEVMTALQESKVDIIELGIPYSDPLADGPVIQKSSMVALQNGMTILKLFEQLKKVRESIQLPIILMGYLNPVLQFGVEKFCALASAVGIDGIILPDLPMHEYQAQYQSIFEAHHLKFIFLITPETSEERIREIDELSTGFIYAVSSSATTGNNNSIEDQADYFNRLQMMNLKNPILIGFGIKDKLSFDVACKYANGAIIGSAFIKALENVTDINQTTKEFINKVVG